ncbi:phosphoribosylformylglycinamidine cyclo-ligase [Striga asiatica]|uniref:Phosphoribosylformylglycinamidine cyclo-ligase n=1 Tax=Striga asiatica TaxID=4170 RepID=A0A5A7PIG1_STRAF|nr:phosphoribosylformylglycinamidine cyclo-ligase [Striga asiatica]
MAAVSLSSASLTPPQLFSSHRISAVSSPSRKPFPVSFAAVSFPEASAVPPCDCEIKSFYSPPRIPIVFLHVFKARRLGCQTIVANKENLGKENELMLDQLDQTY